jgi:hypothetical protein
MNDYQMSKLSQERTEQLHAEADMSRLAAQAREARPAQESAHRTRRGLRALLSLRFARLSDWGEWGSVEWNDGLHRRDPWNV